MEEAWPSRDEVLIVKKFHLFLSGTKAVYSPITFDWTVKRLALRALALSACKENRTSKSPVICLTTTLSLWDQYSEEMAWELSNIVRSG